MIFLFLCNNTSSLLASLACYLLSDRACFNCCSPIAPAFSVGHSFASVGLYHGIINQDSTLVVYALMEVLFHHEYSGSAVQTGLKKKKLDWNTRMG